MTYQLLADLVLTLHAALVVFVVGGLVLTLAGSLRYWQWARTGWFRLAHPAAIAVVVVVGGWLQA